MAHLLPSIGSARFDTQGEFRLAERLRDFMEENTWVWINVATGRAARHPDFIIAHPERGLLVLEVKDWRLETIASVTRSDVQLHTTTGITTVESPLGQVRRYMFDVMEAVQKVPELRFGPGHPHQGKPVIRCGYGVVFTNITRKQYESTDLPEVFHEQFLMFRDEMSESADPEAFREQLWRMVSPNLGGQLSMPQFDRLRGLLFPEIRVTQIALPIPPVDDPQTSPAEDRTLRVMDLAQEQLARSLGEGHRIVRGVAGSGKTLILAFRAEYLARASTNPVLLLCYGNGIAGRLENAMQDRGVEDRVQVFTFHGWCRKMLHTYGIPLPSHEAYPAADAWFAATVQTVLDAVERGHIPSGQYDAVLIDEGHDFYPEWLKLAARMVNPATRALMVVYDDMQAIYQGRKRPVWKQLGIEASGRTTVLKVNYRNTIQILRFARRFAADVIGAPGVPADDEAPVLIPEDGGRDGVDPAVRQCVNVQAEATTIAEWLMVRRKKGYRWSEMAVLVPEHWVAEKAMPVLAAANIPFDLAKANNNRLNTGRDAVRVLSMHNGKGLEFPCVAVAGVGHLGNRNTSLDDEVRLLYVAVTRATHEALLTWSRQSPVVDRVLG